VGEKRALVGGETGHRWVKKQGTGGWESRAQMEEKMAQVGDKTGHW